ncbi:MAG: hemerythrin domain-containing protein [Hyphomicrobiales bacterium]
MALDTKEGQPTLSYAQIMTTLSRHFQSQLGLCAALEDIADSLPHDVNKHKCMLAAQSIPSIVKTAHEFEEKFLYPSLKLGQSKPVSLPLNIERLRAEHCEDESFGDEVADALQELAEGQLKNVDKLSYMLRGFFEGMRRHIAFEQEHLLPLLSNESTSHD